MLQHNSYIRNTLIALIFIVALVFGGTLTAGIISDSEKPTEDITVLTPQLAGVNIPKEMMRIDPATLVPAIRADGIQEHQSDDISTTYSWEDLLRSQSSRDWNTQVDIYTGSYDQRAPNLACDNDDNLYVAFENYDDTYSYTWIEVYSSTDGGQTWGSFGGSYSSYYTMTLPTIVYANGSIFVSMNYNNAILIYRKSTDGSSFDFFYPPTPTLNPPDEVVHRIRMCTDAEGYPTINAYVYLTYLFSQTSGEPILYFTRSTDTGANWSTIQNLGTVTNSYWVGEIGIDWGSSGLFVSYLGTGSNNNKVMVRKSTNYGNSWGAETVIYNNSNNKLGPSMAVHGNNILSVFQYEYSSNDNDVKGVYSTNGGASWNITVIAGSFSDEELPWVANDNSGNFYVTYNMDGTLYGEMANSPQVTGAVQLSTTSDVSDGDFTTVVGFTGTSSSDGAVAAWAGGSSTNLDIFGNSYQDSNDGFARVTDGINISPDVIYETTIGVDNYSCTFTVTEQNGAPITFAEITVHVIGPYAEWDMETHSNVTIQANTSWTYPEDWGYATDAGTYTVYARGRVSGGNWFDFEASGSGQNPVTFNVIEQFSPPDIEVTPLELTIIEPSFRLMASVGDEFQIDYKRRSFIPIKITNGEFPILLANEYVILQFTSLPKPDQLTKSGLSAIHYINNNTIAVVTNSNVNLNDINNLRWYGNLKTTDKISDDLLKVMTNKDNSQNIPLLIECYPGSNKESVESLMSALGQSKIDHPDVPTNFLIYTVTWDVIDDIAGFKEVIWISRASDKLINEIPVYYCPGPITEYGSIPRYVIFNDGWDGPGQGSIDLGYFFQNGTPDIGGENEETAVINGLLVWSEWVEIYYHIESSAGQNESIDILWATGDHCIGSDFDGQGGVLAHAFYPIPDNEPLAGDIHFDEDESWSMTSNVHMFTVALHEAGHSLGIDHSDNPSAVMAPFYSGPVTELHYDDIAAIQSIYAPRQNTITINNVGGSDLVINSINASNSWLMLTNIPSLPYSLPVYNNLIINVDVDWDQLGGIPVASSISIASNDPDEPSISISVTAVPTNNQLSVTPGNIEFPAAGDQAMLTIASNISWSVTDDVVWLSESPTSGTGDGSVTVTCQPNSSVDARQGTITVSGSGLTETINVTQYGVSDMIVSAPDLEAMVGNQFEFCIETTELTTTDGITAYQFDLSYDPIIIEYLGYIKDNTLSSEGLVTPNPQSGIVTIGAIFTSPLSGSGCLIILQFNVLAEGYSGLDLENFLYNTTPINTEDGSVTVINCLLCGDVDDNGIVQAYDAALVLQYAVGLDPLPIIDPRPWEDPRICAANVDENDWIQAYDASLILQYAVGFSVELCPSRDRMTVAPMAEVTVELESNNLVFYSSGGLYGFSMSIDPIEEIALGEPELLIEGALQAVMITDEKYSVGICKAEPIVPGPFLKIPIDIDMDMDMSNITLSINMTVNTEEEERTIEISSLEVDEDAIPSEFTVSNYPNPFNPVTTLRYDLPENSFVKITIYDLLGRKIKTLVNQTQDAGYKSITWNATNDHGKPVSAGVYLYQIRAGEYVQTKKMVLLK